MQQKILLPRRQVTTSTMRSDLQQFLSCTLIDPSTLSTFQKILLTTDGTITHILEVCLLEAIQVVKLSEEIVLLTRDIPFVELTQETEIIDRKVLLRGKTSGKNFIYAESVIFPERLDEKFRDKLLRTKTPIGQIWFDCRVETFKEIFNSGKEPANDLASYFNIQSESNLLFRTYGVFSKQQLIMLITEKFPEHYFTEAC
ncbi:chorismate--pyruvate lyase family protein [Gloeocapsopsis dulcis]|nr:chorismate pyruvate-lyase family protein [Gloeocapsopsis dulcis]WNN88254.1 chorismate pyruvate-lyase family protein [Gloeocapsopsis dulcis]